MSTKASHTKNILWLVLPGDETLQEHFVYELMSKDTKS